VQTLVQFLPTTEVGFLHTMSKKLLLATVTASASLAWYCRTPSGRQQTRATINTVRSKLADLIRPAAESAPLTSIEEVEDLVAEMEYVEEVTEDMPDLTQDIDAVYETACANR